MSCIEQSGRMIIWRHDYWLIISMRVYSLFSSILTWKTYLTLLVVRKVGKKSVSTLQLYGSLHSNCTIGGSRAMCWLECRPVLMMERLCDCNEPEEQVGRLAGRARHSSPPSPSSLPPPAGLTQPSVQLSSLAGRADWGEEELSVQLTALQPAPS